MYLIISYIVPDKNINNASLAVTVTECVNRGGITGNVCWDATTKVSTAGARQTLSSGAKSRGFILERNVYLRAVLVKVDKVQAFVQIRI